MWRMISAAGFAAAILLQSPAFALTAKEKAETCKFGADDQKLTGGARKTFMSKCMANDDKPARHQKMQPPPEQQQK